MKTSVPVFRVVPWASRSPTPARAWCLRPGRGAVRSRVPSLDPWQRLRWAYRGWADNEQPEDSVLDIGQAWIGRIGTVSPEPDEIAVDTAKLRRHLLLFDEV